MSDDDSDLDDLLREERSRGRRPVDMEARQLRERVREQLHEVCRDGTEADFRALIRAYGVPAGSDRETALLRLWRAARGAGR